MSENESENKGVTNPNVPDWSQTQVPDSPSHPFLKLNSRMTWNPFLLVSNVNVV